ncbi:hypothetical protein HG15A2_39560 [Adhaeretor mobilis]|uniref:Uncharacterized protein n=1 Tax=Adhaeretor mobilis TaxID=1930276 RepID=A0A517N0F9_9BACT|nr:hypothetical protein HG15A2_39560 [Adhaeretor mobilis]
MDKQITSLCSQLGWGKPHSHYQIQSDIGTSTGLFWYEAGDIGDPRTDCFLQVNELECRDQARIVKAAVYAPRYRLCTGWHVIRFMMSTEESVLNEAVRLRQWLHRDNFTNLESRRKFRSNHPETTGYSWRVLRKYGPPFYVTVDNTKGIANVETHQSEKCKQAISNSDSPE